MSAPVRRNERVAIRFQLEVSGGDLQGRDFVDKAWTRMVGRSGAAIVIDRLLAPEQTLMIKRLGSPTEAEVRVIGRIGAETDGDVYGVAFVNPPSEIWGIDFPEAAADETLVNVLLECPRCQLRQIVALTELELSVFEANNNLSRHCCKCRDVTLWKQSLYEAPSEPAPAAPPRTSAVPPTASTPQPIANRRKHPRLKVKQKGCILFYGQEIPIEVTDMSRGGIRFYSPRNFAEGAPLRVAIPYTPGAANIFVAARICWSRPLPSGKTECGLMYVKD